MKKVYSIPTVEVIQLTTVATILEGSNSGEATPGGGNTRPAANENRGEWGSLWDNK